MALQKRKAVAKASTDLFKRAKRGKNIEKEAEPEVEEKPEDEEQEQEAAAPEEAEAEEQVSEEEALARMEEETTNARRKELKAMPVADVKQLVESHGLDMGNKADMIEAVVAQEAKQRADARAQEAKLRAVVVEKKEELEALQLPDLKDRCNEMGIKGQLTKQARIELLLKQWQENDGVDKALAKHARDAREQELSSMDKAALQKLCDAAGVNPFIKEVIVDRVVRCEKDAGRFAPPAPEKEPEQASAAKPSDMVEALLANEANRKKELERKKQEEEATANTKKELKAMSVEDLKKELTSKGHEATGKKEELVEALFKVQAQEQELEARRAKLRSMGLDELKGLLTSKGLPVGKKDGMVEALMAHEAKARQDALAYESQVIEVLAKKKDELEGKTNSDLKELCVSKGLKLGVGKEERVERLLEEAKTSGEVTGILVVVARDARREELAGMELEALLELSAAAGADPLVKEVMVDRLLSHEDEFGRTAVAEPPAKRARTSKK